VHSIRRYLALTISVPCAVGTLLLIQQVVAGP
jgi:hypothetical protein